MVSVPLPRKRRTQGPYAALVSAVERASEKSKSGLEKVKTEQVDVPLSSEGTSSANLRSPLALQRHQFIKRERRTPEFHSSRTQSPANASYGWKHPEELEYIQSSEWDEDKIIGFAITHSFSIPPKTSRNSIFFCVKDVNDVDTTLPMRYRVPLLWVSRFLWTSIYLVLTAKERQKEWEEFKYGILHVARLLDKFLRAARDAATVERGGGLDRKWRCPMFDRALVRYKLRWLLNDPASVEEFWKTYGEDEFSKDVIMFDWKRWALHGQSGFRLLESDIVKGLTSEELQTGLSKERGQWCWSTKSPPAILADALKDNSTEAPSLPTQNGNVKPADKPKNSIPLPGRQKKQRAKKQATASTSTAVKKEPVDTSPFKDGPVEVIPEPYVPNPSFTGVRLFTNSPLKPKSQPKAQAPTVETPKPANPSVTMNAGRFQTSIDGSFTSGPIPYNPYMFPPSARGGPFSAPAPLPQFYGPLSAPGNPFGFGYGPMVNPTPIAQSASVTSNPSASTANASNDNSTGAGLSMDAALRFLSSASTALSGSGTVVASGPGSNLDSQALGKIVTAFTESINYFTDEVRALKAEVRALGEDMRASRSSAAHRSASPVSPSLRSATMGLRFKYPELDPRTLSHPPPLPAPAVLTPVDGASSKLKTLSWASEGTAVAAGSARASAEAPSAKSLNPSPIRDVEEVEMPAVSATAQDVMQDIELVSSQQDASRYSPDSDIIELAYPDMPSEAGGEDAQIETIVDESEVEGKDQMDVDEANGGVSAATHPNPASEMVEDHDRSATDVDGDPDADADGDIDDEVDANGVPILTRTTFLGPIKSMRKLHKLDASMGGAKEKAGSMWKAA